MKVCVITGGAGGMGVECAKIMGKREKLLLVDVSAEKLEAAVSEISECGIEGVETAVCDITDRDQVKALAQQAAALGEVNSVLHLAGLGHHCEPAAIAAVNGKAVYYMIEEFVDVIAEGGSMVTVNSLSTHINHDMFQRDPNGVPEFFDYPEADDFVDKMVAYAEAFVEKIGGRAPVGGVTYGLAKYFSWRYSLCNVQRFADKGLRINTVTPGVITTPMGDLEDEGVQRQLAQMAIQKPGKPHEMAAAICWLTEDTASVITGIDLPVDGGISALKLFPQQKGTAGEEAYFAAKENAKAKESILNKWGPDQLSYTVRDIDAAVQEFYELFGAGPFLKMGPMHYESCNVRGDEADPEIVIALGMWGQIQVEFVQKLNDEAMLFDENGYGFNHVNVIVDNYDEAIAWLSDHGYEPGQEMYSSGKPIAYVDTMKGENIGHHLEIHEYNPVIEMTKKATEIWDGKEPYMDLQTVIAAMRG